MFPYSGITQIAASSRFSKSLKELLRSAKYWPEVGGGVGNLERTKACDSSAFPLLTLCLRD